MELVSATQISSYDDCKRKWVWRSIAKIESEQHASAKLGTEVHEQLERYLRDGTTFDYSRDSGYIAASALAFLPEPKTPGLELEHHFKMPSPSWRTHPFAYQGFKDLYHRDSSVMPGLLGGVPLVSDFKTTSNLRYAKSESRLATDVQAMVYATWALFDTRAEAVDLAWIYMQTRNARKAVRRHLRVLAPHVIEQFKRIDERAVGMHELRQALATVDPAKAAFEVEPNIEMCDEYGGCPYRANCNLAPSVFVDADVARDLERMETEMNNGATGGFLSRIKKQATEAKAEIAPPPPIEALAQGPDLQPINPPESKLVVPPKPQPDPVGADIAMHAGLDTPKDEPKKRTSKKTEASTVVNNFSAPTDDKFVKAIAAAAKAFLEALG
jgi:hypothetical protein